jgi:hypothetical protein
MVALLAAVALLTPALLLCSACSRNSGTPPPDGATAGAAPGAAGGGADLSKAPPLVRSDGGEAAAMPGPAMGAPVAGSAGAASASGSTRSAAGVRWSSPAGWQVAPDRPMRVVTYRIPAAKGDPEDAECGVFFFGAGQGGGVEANLQRWLGQFIQPDGRATQQVARRAEKSVNSMKITSVDVGGTYMFSPTPMSSETTPKAGFRMLGAIVEAPEGNVFFKLTGPAATVAAASRDFDALVTSLSRG